MRKRNLLLAVCGLALAGWLNVAAAAAGLILGFQAGDDVALISVASADRVPASRSMAGATWMLAATGKDGTLRWTSALAAPRVFHGDPHSAVSFSTIVPAVQNGDRLSMTDAHGFLLWSRIVDDAMLANAIQTKHTIDRQLNTAYSATSKLQQNTSKSGLSVFLGSEETSTQYPSPVAVTAEALAIAKSAKTGSGGPIYHVSGTVVTNNADVRVFDASTNELIASGRTNWINNRFDFDLPGGRYVFEEDDNQLRVDTPFFYRTPYRTAPIVVNGNTEVPEIPQHDEAGVFELTARVPCSVVAQSSTFSASPIYHYTATIVSEDGTRIQRDHQSFQMMVAPAPNTGDEYCPVIFRFQLSPGLYTIELAIPGWEAMQFDEVRIVDGSTVQDSRRLRLQDRTLVWTGKIVDATDAPMRYVHVNVIRETGQPSQINFLNLATGRFEISYSRDWTVEFEPSRLSDRESAIRQRYVLANGQPPAKVILQDVAIGNTLDDGLLRIYGDGNRNNHFNLLFLAEGYTDAQESFTDTNGNGHWDAIVWHDLNGNGVFDNQDRYERYGQPDSQNLQLPDPSVGNEPFTDLNNDGMLNVNEPAKFERNARDFMRSFLGSDFWYEHRQAFNAYVLFEPSEQSGFDITTESGEVSVERATNYAANLVQPRMLMNIDRQAAMNRALVAMPDVDMVVVLVNQNVFTFARGNVTLAQPGMMVWPSGLQYPLIADTGPAHEMGHYAAALCDEYAEYAGVHPLHGNPSTGCPNTSYLSDPKEVPWSNWILRGTASPTRNLDGSLGIYAGAQYYEGGAYRPSFDSLMREIYPLFNAPSRVALEMAVHTRTGEWHDEADASGRCVRLPLNSIHRRGVACQ